MQHTKGYWQNIFLYVIVKFMRYLTFMLLAFSLVYSPDKLRRDWECGDDFHALIRCLGAETRWDQIEKAARKT